MLYQIQNCKCGNMCFDPENGHVYTASSSNVRTLSFPDAKERIVFDNTKYARLTLSSDNAFLAIYNGHSQLRVYRTADPRSPVFQHKWRDIATTDEVCLFTGEDALILSVQDHIYKVSLQGAAQMSIILGDPHRPPNRSNWRQNGHICSLSTRGQEIAALHHSFDPFETRFLYSPNGGNGFEQRVLPAQLHGRYKNLLLHPKGGMCLLGTIEGFPMLYYDSVEADLLLPDQAVDFSGVHWPRFSPGGRYLTFVTLSSEPPHYKCWLVDASSWKVLQVVEKETCNPSFSNDERYWLLPGKKPSIIDLNDWLERVRAQ